MRIRSVLSGEYKVRVLTCQLCPYCGVIETTSGRYCEGTVVVTIF
jgi:hypothetical protein